MEKYDDIINLPHHVSKKHPRLSMEQRAAQFAPFAALTGFGDAINEISRITENRIELDDEEKLKIDNILQKLINKISNKPKVTITYFIPDLRKTGGEYKTKIGNLKKIDECKQLLVLEDKTEIPIKEIIEILD
ncbi:MAG: hypothetical protein IJE05_04840 [Clostridia bacterium]|nr:hypothetical protein [Clostridia bacterium]